uniref:Uncharacterized protein n=1 Tax=viral metagenome TaxID=1070528 RepID=A0A6C0EVG3_9ZZZZ
MKSKNIKPKQKTKKTNNKGGSKRKSSKSNSRKKLGCDKINLTITDKNHKKHKTSHTYITETLKFLPITEPNPMYSSGGASFKAMSGYAAEGMTVPPPGARLFPLAIYDNTFEDLRRIAFGSYRGTIESNARGAGATPTAEPFHNTFCTVLVALFLFGKVRNPIQEDTYQKLIRLRLRLGEFNVTQPELNPRSWQMYNCAVNEDMPNPSDDIIIAKLSQLVKIPDGTMGAVLARISWKNTTVPHVSIILYRYNNDVIEFRLIELQSPSGIEFIPGTKKYNDYMCRIKTLSIVSGSAAPGVYSKLLLGKP